MYIAIKQKWKKKEEEQSSERKNILLCDSHLHKEITQQEGKEQKKEEKSPRRESLKMKTKFSVV